MTVSNQTNSTSAVGAGAVLAIPYTFPTKESGDLIVEQRVTSTGVPTPLTETTDYTATYGSTGGTVTTVNSIAATDTVHVTRNTPMTQTLDLITGGLFNAENVEAALDRNTKLVIDSAGDINRTPKLLRSDPSTSVGNWPSSIDRASKVASFDSAGKPTASSAVPTGSVSFSTIGTNIAEAADADAVMVLLQSFTSTAKVGDIQTKGPWHDVRAYGATGDGSTDDTVAIAAAIAAAANKTLFIPNGTYIHTGLTVATATHIVLDEKAILKKKAGAHSADITVTAGNTIIEGGTFNGNRANQTGGATAGIITVTSADNCTIRNTIVTGGITHGIYFTESDNPTVRNCFVTDVDDYGILFLVASAAAANVICVNNTVDKVAESTGATFGCIKIHGASGKLYSNFVIADNICLMPISTTASTLGIETNAYVIYGTITGNVCIGSTIPISALGNDIVVTGNTCYNGSTYGIEVEGSNMTVTGNVLDNGGLGKYGISSDGDDNVLSSNLIRNLENTATAFGIVTTATNDGASITGNVIEQPAGGKALQLRAAHATVTGNVFDKHIIIDDAAADYITISGNVLNRDEGAFGIEWETGGTGLTITNNVIESASTSAIRIALTTSEDYVTITNNNFTDSTLGIEDTMTGSGAIGDNSIVHNPPDDFYRAYTASTPTLDLWAPARLDGTDNTVTATLGDGKYPNQTFFMYATNVDNAVKLVVSHHETDDDEDFTFDTVGDSLLLMWDMTDWVTIKNKGVTVP